MGQVFYNCRLYNGTESFVGKIGVDLNREYDNLLQAYGLKERFDNKIDTNALIAEIIGTQVHKEDHKSHQTQSNIQETHHDFNYEKRELNRSTEVLSSPDGHRPPHRSFSQNPNNEYNEETKSVNNPDQKTYNMISQIQDQDNLCQLDGNAENNVETTRMHLEDVARDAANENLKE